jgi:uncharacterized protein (TIGR03437 family)
MIESARAASRLGALAVALSCAVLPAQSDRDQRYRDDLQYLATQLPARHVNAFHQIGRDQFNAEVNALNNDIPLIGDTEIMVRMAQIVASIGEAHTSLPLPQGPTPFRWFPFTFYGFDDGWRVNAVRPDLAQLLGCRIVQIGDTPIDDVYSKVAIVISHENDQWLKQQFPDYARWADVLKTVGVIASLDSAQWTFEALDGHRFSLEIVTIPQGSISGVGLPDRQGFAPLYTQNTALNYWYTYIESTRTMYVAYNRCTDSDPPFSLFTQQVFGIFDTTPVDRLIIDLRNNPGGNSTVFDPFLAALQARQSRFASGTKKIVIIGRKTISSSLLNAISLKSQPDTVLIGEPTGGKPNSYGETQNLTLPNSGATLSYSTKLFSSPITTESLLPDRTILFYSRDSFARHDPFLATALLDQFAPSPPGLDALRNGASFRPGPVAPGSLATLFVSLPGASGAASSFPLPAKLAGLEVRFNDQAARLAVVTPGQINLQIPFGISPGAANLQVIRDGVEAFSAVAPIASSGPGLFLADSTRGDQPGAVLNQDSRPNSSDVRARRGEVIQIFATGDGPLDSPVADGAPPPVGADPRTVNPPRAFVAAENAEVVYSGMSPEFPGLWQINVRLPDAPSISKQVPVFVIADGVVSNAVTVWVEE